MAIVPRLSLEGKRAYTPRMRLGRYELLSKIATGGMGEVFLARRRGPGKIEKRVVIKRIRRDLSGDPRFVELFLREARLSMTLSHKNIATVFDFGRAGAELFLAMEYVAGRDLARALRAAATSEAPSLSPTAAAHIGIEVCQALDYAHRSSGDEPIIHRDLSPKNLLVSFSGEIVVADFGLAIATGEQLEKAGVRGTPAYMSPEQARGEPLDPRSDLFSLGLVLHEIITGEAAYRGDEPHEIIELAKDAAVSPLGDDVSEALRAIVEKATAPDLAERYPSARAMQLALDKYLVTARAAGASPPGIEIASWLDELFDERTIEESPVETTGEGLGHAVTYLEDGADAVAFGARDLSSAGSLAATIGDSELEEDESAPDKPAPPSRRRWLPLAGVSLAAVAALIIGGISIMQSNKPTTIDASVTPRDVEVPPIDASGVVVIDAAPIDVPRIKDAAPALDAKPAVVAPKNGWIRVQSRPWARVRVAKSSKGCAETPCRLRLPIGPQTLILTNPVTGAKTTRRVTVVADTTVDVTVVLPRPK